MQSPLKWKLILLLFVTATILSATAVPAHLRRDRRTASSAAVPPASDSESDYSKSDTDSQDERDDEDVPPLRRGVVYIWSLQKAGPVHDTVYKIGKASFTEDTADIHNRVKTGARAARAHRPSGPWTHAHVRVFETVGTDADAFKLETRMHNVLGKGAAPSGGDVALRRAANGAAAGTPADVDAAGAHHSFGGTVFDGSTEFFDSAKFSEANAASLLAAMYGKALHAGTTLAL